MLPEGIFFRDVTQLQGNVSDLSQYKRAHNQGLFCNARTECRVQVTTWAVEAHIIKPAPTHSENSARFIKRLTKVVNLPSKPMANFEWIFTGLLLYVSDMPKFSFIFYCVSLGVILVYLSLELRLSFMRDSPLETKSKVTDKNLRMEIAEFQTGLDASKSHFQSLWNPAVRTENKTEMCLKEFWLSEMIDLWDNKGRIGKQMQFVKKRCKIAVYILHHVVS